MTLQATPQIRIFLALIHASNSKLMNLAPVKLHLIRRILQIEDPELLRTLARLLEGVEQRGEEGQPIEGFPPPSSTPLDEDAREIQDAIDETFNLHHNG